MVTQAELAKRRKKENERAEKGRKAKEDDERQKRIDAGNKFIQDREKQANIIAGGADVPTRADVAQASDIVAERPETPVRTQEEVIESREEVSQEFEDRGVFKEPVIEPIISPEQENLGVIGRIAKDIIPDIGGFSGGIFGDKSVLKGTIFESKDKQEPISQAEITTITADLQESIVAETSLEIDKRIDDAEIKLIQNGIPILPVVGGAVVASAIAGPTREFVGTDGQISSLELALSQYNEMLTIPSRSLDSGLSTSEAFDKYDRMEDNILALERQLKISSQTSPKVALALKGRAIEARILKLKEKIQEGRRKVASRVLSEGFGEVDIPKSLVFLNKLQNDRKSNDVKGGK